jgi:hypothetical protein
VKGVYTKMATVKLISGIQVGKLRSLKPVLNEWMNLTNRKNWFFESDDATWWNNERATLSVLAGAIWRRKGLVIEEFATEKIMKSESKAGRCDISFLFRKNVFIGEAKQNWPLLTGENLKANLIKTNKVIKQACHVSLHTKGSKATRLGIVFITPRIHEGKKQLLNDFLMDYLNKLSAKKDITLAWTFPKWARDLHSSEEGNQNYIYPGVILVIKQTN